MTISLIQKDYLSNIDAMRDVFFSKETDDASLRRFQKLLNEYSTPMLVLDLKLLRVRPLHSLFSHFNIQLVRGLSFVADTS